MSSRSRDSFALTSRDRSSASTLTRATDPLMFMASLRRSSAGAQGGSPASRGSVDPGEHEGADDYPAGAEGDQPRVGGVQAEDHPAGELAQDEQPGSGGDAGGPGRSVGRPERRRDLEQ